MGTVGKILSLLSTYKRYREYKKYYFFFQIMLAHQNTLQKNQKLQKINNFFTVTRKTTTKTTGDPHKKLLNFPPFKPKNQNKILTKKQIKIDLPNTDANLPNLIQPNLDILFVGINPGSHSFREKHHFAGPVNHFWQCLYKSGLTSKLHNSSDDIILPKLYKIGITNMVKIATKLASDISEEQWRFGANELLRELEKTKPKFLIFNGISTYRHFLNFAVIPKFKSENQNNPNQYSEYNKSYIYNKMKILPGLQNIKICNNQTQIFAIPSSSPLARVTVNEKVFYYKEIKKLIERANLPVVYEREVFEVNSQERKNERYCRDWVQFFSQSSF